MAVSCKPKSIDVSGIRFTNVKELKSGGRMVNLNYKGGKLYIQTPAMPLPYGLNDSKDMDEKLQRPPTPRRFDMNLSFRDVDRNPAVKVLRDKLLEIGEAAIEAGFNNRVAWFSKDYKGMRSFVENMFTPLVKTTTDKETGMPSTRYSPTLKVKVPYDAASDKFGFECTDMNKVPLDFASVKDNLKGGSVQVLFEVRGVWISGGMFGLTTSAVKVRVEQSVTAEADFEEDSDDEKVAADTEDEELVAHLAAAPPPPPPPAPKKTVAAKQPAILPDSEDEEEEEPEKPAEDEAEDEEADADSEVEEEEEREPTPPPPPPKKTVTKKTVAKAK